ncbi:MAG: hypothetical protein ACREMR_02230 [Gemmatimonadales bacterium]
MALTLGLGGGGCRERAVAVRDEAELRRMVDQMVPRVEAATGLRFRHPPVVARRTRAQINDYIIQKLDAEYPPDELAGYQTALRLFGLIPDTLDLRRTFVTVLTEQVAGFYDPDSGALYIAGDLDDALRVRLTVSHELVHALQDQYVKLDSIVRQRRQNDRRLAAHAVLEGQATLAQIGVMMPEQRVDTLAPNWFWSQREVTAALQSQMPQFASAPLWLREGLVFPYLAGADFVNWFGRRYPGAHPFPPRMPSSTEHILHPDRFLDGDEPTGLAFVRAEGIRYEDGLGEFEIRVLLTELTRVEARGAALAAAWDGDRFAVIDRDALVWYSVWDDDLAADRFARGLERAWADRRAAGSGSRRFRIKRLTVEGRPAVRLVDAPPDWSGWHAIPTVTTVAPSTSPQH